MKPAHLAKQKFDYTKLGSALPVKASEKVKELLYRAQKGDLQVLELTKNIIHKKKTPTPIVGHNKCEV
jgi:hypothetical protein